MELEQEYSKNRVMMKKIKKTSSLTCIGYAIYLIMAIFCIFVGIMTANLLIGLSSIFVVAASVLGFLGVYKKDNRLLIASLVIIVVQFLLFALSNCDGLSDFIGALICSGPGYAVIIAYVCFSIRNNKQYHWLEQQDGFPNFEVKQAMYEMNKSQREIKDPYAIRKEELEKRTENAGHMDEL